MTFFVSKNSSSHLNKNKYRNVHKKIFIKRLII